MKFTDFFIRRPVLAISISLLMVILGLQAAFKLPIKEYPTMTTSVVSVQTTFAGADASLMQSFVTSTLEEAVAQADNVDYMKSSSSAGSSNITVKMKLNTDPDLALANISSKVNSVRKRLPNGVDDPIVSVSSGSMNFIMLVSFKSKDLHISQVTDYVERNIKPQFFTVNGVAQVNVFGGAKYAFRIWLDPDKLASYKLSTAQINAALSNNNIQSAAGNSNGYYTYYKNSIKTTADDLETLQNLAVFEQGNLVVRLKDVAKVELEKSSDSIRASSNGEEAVVLAIEPTSTANPIVVAKNIYPLYENIAKNLPAEINSQILYDQTIPINQSIQEVVKTILEASIIVLFVILAFIGSVRAILIPVITIPISLIGVILLLQWFGFSINLMTLLALILAIGLVVDDAIVVLENVDRLIKKGMSPFEAAIQGTREITVPVISTTLALCAVYSPMAIAGGITGALFKEFALTLAGAVLISSIIALTLSPMMSSRLLKHNDNPTWLENRVENTLTRINTIYDSLLETFLNKSRLVLVFAVVVFGSIPIAMSFLSSELTPTEDKNTVMAMGSAPDHANINYVSKAAKDFESQVRSIPEVKATQIIAGVPGSNSAFMFAMLEDVHNRSRSQTEIQKELGNKGNAFVPMSFSAFSPSEVNTGERGMPVNLTIKTSKSYEDLAIIAEDIKNKAQASGKFMFVNTDLKFTTPKSEIAIDKEKAATYGVSMADISRTIGSYLSGATTARIDIDGKTYDVISQVEKVNRLIPEDFNNYHVENNRGESVPLSSFITVKVKSEPSSLSKLSQLNSVSIAGVPLTSVGDATNFLKALAQDLPSDYQYEFMGESRQLEQEGNTIAITFALAVVLIYLVLAIQFESWRDPFVIMISVPLAVSGSLITLNLLGLVGFGTSTLNIYSQIGLITLVGLITKHGILICEVAKEQQLLDKSRLEAVKIAAGLRLRPILMTTFAMIAGLIPLLFAVGAGASARFSIGIVIVAGLAIGTLFTLFVLPVVYSYIAKTHKPLQEIPPHLR